MVSDTATTEMYALSLHDDLPISLIAGWSCLTTHDWMPLTQPCLAAITATHGARPLARRSTLRTHHSPPAPPSLTQLEVRIRTPGGGGGARRVRAGKGAGGKAGCRGEAR